MARVKFLTDEHIPNAVANGLRARGIDAATAAQARLRGTDDASFLARAKADDRVMLTHEPEPDFLRLHAAGVPHAGILYAPRETPIGDLIRGALLIAEILDADAMINHVEFL